MAASRKSTGQPLFGAAIPMLKAVKLDPEHMLDALRDVVGHAGARVRLIDEIGGGGSLLSGLRSKPVGFICEVAGVRLSITVSPKPLCDSSAMHAFINPAVWRGSSTGIKEHRAHILIAEEEGNTGTGTDAMFDRATAITLGAAAMASMVEAEGVIWLPGRNALPIGAFGTEMERFIDGQAPLQFWIRCQVLPAPVQAEHDFGKLSGDALQPGVATIGLAAFIGAEIIAPPSTFERELMLDHILGLASSVIDENSPLKDGGIYGKPDGLTVQLLMRKAGQYSERPYWELVPVAAPAPKPEPEPQPKRTVEVSDEGAEDLPPPRLRLVVPGR
jgi:hypothetical protein